MNAIIVDAIRSDYRLADSDGSFFRPDPAPALSDAEYRDLCRRVRESEARATETYSSAPPRPVAPLPTCARDGCERRVNKAGSRYCSRACSAASPARQLPGPPPGVPFGQPHDPPRVCECGRTLLRRHGEKARHFMARQSCDRDCARVARRRAIMDAVAAGEWGGVRRGARTRAPSAEAFVPSAETRELMERPLGRGRRVEATS